MEVKPIIKKMPVFPIDIITNSNVYCLVDSSQIMSHEGGSEK